MARLDRLLLLLLASGLVVAVVGPAVPLLGQHFLGLEFVDHYGTQWFYWFAEQTLTGGASPLRAEYFFYPWGKDVLGHTGANLLDAYLALPFRALLGPVLGYNVFVMTGLALSGLAFLPLGRQLSDDRFAVGLGALLVALSPYALGEAVEGRPTQAILALPLLFLAALVRTGRHPGLKAPLVAGLLLALVALQYWYYALFAGLAALAHGLFLAWRPPPGGGGGRALLARHALIAVVGLTLVSPLLLPMLAGLDTAPGLLAVQDWGWRGAAPVVDGELRVGLFVWQPLRAAAGFFVQPEDTGPAFLERFRWTSGLALPLVLLGAWRLRPPLRGAWLAMAVVLGLVALGPLLLVGSTAVPNMAYIWLSQLLPPMRRLWWPARAHGLLGPLLVLAAVVGLAWVRARLGPWAGRATAVVLVAGQAGLLRDQGLLPFPTWDATVPAGYRCLAEGPPGAIVDLPFAWTQGHLYYQTRHGRPMLGGMLENNPSFSPPELSSLMEDNTLVRGLVGITGGEVEGEPLRVSSADRKELIDLGYRYVVLQEDAFSRAARARSLLDNALRSRHREVRRQLAALLGQPVYDDARVSIYDLQGGARPCGVELAPDLESPGMTAASATELVRWDPRRSPVGWIFGEEGGERAPDPRGLLWGAAEAEAPPP